ncbi:MAG: penicillin-binding protein 2 [Alphaproteobacteria bacterium]
MRRDLTRGKLFTRRAALLAGGKAALIAALAGRLYDLQVVRSDQYALLADENRINLRLLPPPRGRIVDRFGEALAVNRLTYRVVLVPEQTPSVEETLEALSALIPISDHDVRRVLREAGRKRGFVPITVGKDLTWAEVSRIEVNMPDLPGVSIDVGQSRHYPFDNLAAHVTGYVAPVSEADLTGDPLLELPDFRIGKSGVEKAYDLALRGSAGHSRVEVNAYGRVIREVARREGRPGEDLVLTLDMGLQAYVTRRLAGESGAAVVLDVRNGDVLALVSTPGYEPNAFSRGLSQESWQVLIGNPRTPLLNRAVAGQYPPGSTVKMIVALAALENGVVTPNHRVFCPGYMEVGDRTFHCWKRGGHGALAMVDAIVQSCDVYFYDIARRAGVDRIAEMARRFGLGERSGLDLPGEQPGLVPTPGWKFATKGMPWQKGETLVIGIGQGYLLTTPLQLAVMTARLSNGGISVTPHLARRAVERSGDEGEPVFGSVGISPASLAVVTKGMARATNDPKGTAYEARIPEPEMAMAGKTGTAQVRRLTNPERDGHEGDREKPWAEQEHALFVAYAPVRAPRYAVAVVIEHGGAGSKAAAPVARDILRETQHRDPARRGVPGGIAGLGPRLTGT